MMAPYRFRSLLVLVGGLVAAVLFMSMFRSAAGNAVLLFGRLDVLACSLLLALPLAMRITEHFHATALWIKAALALLCGSISALLLQSAIGLTHSSGGSELTLTLWRTSVALLAMLGLGLFHHCLAQPRSTADVGLPAGAIHLLLLLAAVLVPSSYADAVADGLRSHLQQSLENQRTLRAYQQAAQLSQLKPHWKIGDVAVDRLRPQLQEAVERLLSEAQLPLGDSPSLSQLGRRITVLVQLERPQAALPLVRSLTAGPTPHPVALDFLGLCYQRLEQPNASLQAYRRAVEYWTEQPPSGNKSNGMASALRGIAFAARRLEDRTLEEVTYRELLQVAPTAEHHFLMAQCYREHQKTALAAEHARQASELDPAMSDSTNSILRTLSMDHFGCLQVPR